MKIAISSINKNIESEVSDVFGRCPYFLIVDVEDREIGEVKVLENKSVDQMGGAGITAAQVVAQEAVDAVITQNVGPRALDVLRQFDIDVYYSEGTAKEALNELITGNLKKIS